MEKSEKTWGGWITVVLVINFNWIKFRTETNWIRCIFIFLILTNCDSTKGAIHWWFCICKGGIGFDLDWSGEWNLPCWTQISDSYCPSQINSQFFSFIICWNCSNNWNSRFIMFVVM
jgi:hypothetical protein